MPAVAGPKGKEVPRSSGHTAQTETVGPNGRGNTMGVIAGPKGKEPPRPKS